MSIPEGGSLRGAITGRDFDVQDAPQTEKAKSADPIASFFTPVQEAPVREEQDSPLNFLADVVVIESGEGLGEETNTRQDAIASLQSGDAMDYKYPSQIEKGGQRLNHERAALRLKSYGQVYEAKNGEGTFKAFLEGNSNYQKLLNEISSSSAPENKINDWAEKNLPKALGMSMDEIKSKAQENFKSNRPEETSRKIEDTGLVERERVINGNSLSGDFLTMQNKGEIQQQHLQNASSFRASEEKSDVKSSGQTVNHSIHHVENEKGEKVTLSRSGAFTVQKKARESMGDSEIQALCVAQALPKVMFGLQEAVQQNPGLLKGNKLTYAEQSLMTNRGKEALMISDTKDALEYIGQNVKVKVVNDLKYKDNPTLMKEEGQEIVYLYSEHGKEEVMGVETLFFTNGVNEWATKGTRVDDEKINSISRDRLFERAEKIMEELDNIATDNPEGILECDELKENIKKVLIETMKHFVRGPPKNAEEAQEDMYQTQKLLDVMGAAKGIMCKSGKDRTSMAHAAFTSAQAERNGWVEDKAPLRESLKTGLSLQIAAWNIGVWTFAINALQKMWFPSDLIVPCNFQASIGRKEAT